MTPNVGENRRRGCAADRANHNELQSRGRAAKCQSACTAQRGSRAGRRQRRRQVDAGEDPERPVQAIGIDIPSVDTPVAKLSGGQRQAIAVALAVRQQNIKILLLDEPLSAMGQRKRPSSLRSSKVCRRS
jgi:ABC-type Mn2+/Zn2+ transport system ATPase subunit